MLRADLNDAVEEVLERVGHIGPWCLMEKGMLTRRPEVSRWKIKKHIYRIYCVVMVYFQYLHS